MNRRWAEQIRKAHKDGGLRSLGISEVDAANILKIIDPAGEKKVEAAAVEAKAA